MGYEHIKVGTLMGYDDIRLSMPNEDSDDGTLASRYGLRRMEDGIVEALWRHCGGGQWCTKGLRG